MGEKTKIGWCDHTFNPWIGCTKISPACDHCYAERYGKRIGIEWGPHSERRRTSAANRKLPLRWNERARIQHDAWERFKAENPGLTDAELTARGFVKPRRPRVFCASLADVFDNAVPDWWRIDLFRLIYDTPHLDWLLLTKRIGNYSSPIDAAIHHIEALPGWENEDAPSPPLERLRDWLANWIVLRQAPANVWLGATVCNQTEADRDIPKLLTVPTVKRFLSIEPMLGPINLASLAFWTDENDQICQHDGRDPDIFPDIHWVICGGESGPHARPMHPDWARGLRDQCNDAGTPFFFKQWGEYDLSYDRNRDDPDCRRCADMNRLPGRWINIEGGHGFHGKRIHYAHRVGKQAAGRLLDGREWNEVPA